MCYLDINNNLGLNKKFMRMTSPTIAAYWSMLQGILVQVRAKNKFDPATGMWKIDRRYVFSETGINTDDQKKSDAVMFRLGIITKIDPENPDRMAVDVKRYYELLLDETLVPEDLLPKTVKMTATDQKAIKKAAIIKGIVKLFNETDDRAIEAVTKLVDVYYSQHGYCKKSQWEPIVQMLHACTTDPDGISEIVDYILTTNWQSIQAAIDSFMKKHKPTGTKLNSQQKVCTGTLEGVEF